MNHNSITELQAKLLSDEEVTNMLDMALRTGKIPAKEVEQLKNSMNKLKKGDDAPDGHLFSIDSKEVTLHSLFSNKKPTVLNFGSYT